MMQILPIVLVATLLVSESEHAAYVRVEVPGWLALLIGLAAVMLVVASAAAAVSWNLRASRKRQPVRSVIRADRVLRLATWLIVVIHACVVLVLGGLDVIRSIVGDLPGVDELIALLLPCAGLTALWAITYSIDQRTRSATLIRRMDSGVPIHDMPSRSVYVLQQVRVQCGLMHALVS